MWRHLNRMTCYVMILLVAYNIRIHAVQSARDAILCNIDYSRLVLLIVGVGFFMH